jgi:hypothetical protein
MTANTATNTARLIWPAGAIRMTQLELRKLNLATCSEGDIAQIIGNDSWTELKCDHCDVDQPALVQIEGEYDTFCICESCLASAAQAIEARRPETENTGSVGDESAAPKGCAQ